LPLSSCYSDCIHRRWMIVDPSTLTTLDTPTANTRSIRPLPVVRTPSLQKTAPSPPRQHSFSAADLPDSDSTAAHHGDLGFVSMTSDEIKLLLGTILLRFVQEHGSYGTYSMACGFSYLPRRICSDRKIELTTATITMQSGLKAVTKTGPLFFITIP
ncbi:hypothetical protein AKJ16_DCAP16038, partial [Drosera capensis]